MESKYADLFRALCQPFDRDEVKVRPQGGKQLQYITARTAMNRLDDVLGWENWWDEYIPMENSVLCKLTIRLPDGSTITKSDAGGYAGMTDHGDDDKSGYSDAFKRAGVKFGIGRYLYRDGLPQSALTSPDKPRPPSPAPRQPKSGPGKQQAKPAPPPPYRQWLQEFVETWNTGWIRDHPDSGIESILSFFQVNNHLLKHFRIDMPNGSTQPDRIAVGEQLWKDRPREVKAEAYVYANLQWDKAEATAAAEIGIETEPVSREPGSDDNR